jgi:formate hydrogenlyase subunit 6/NADH:ubiquinone oxidoreductase subunit I
MNDPKLPNMHKTACKKMRKIVPAKITETFFMDFHEFLLSALAQIYHLSFTTERHAAVRKLLPAFRGFLHHNSAIYCVVCE